jgi:phosphatidyl-myo-inositol dimannoside synthase
MYAATASDKANIILIANNFPPVRGGSAIVYHNLACCRPDRIRVIAPTTNYVDGLPLIGWREHDICSTYKVDRLPLLRTPLNPQSATRIPAISSLGFRIQDAYIRANVVSKILEITSKLRCPISLCLGELAASGWLLKLLKPVPYIKTSVYIHGEELTTLDRHDPQKDRCKSRLAASDGVISVSSFTENVIQNILGINTKVQTALIENGVNCQKFYPRPKRMDLVERYGLDDGFVFVSVCRLLEKKGVDNTIRAFASLASALPSARLLIVGTGDYGNTLKQIAAETDVNSRIIFTGEVTNEDLPDHYALGDVFVMPNRAMPDGDTEGFGLVFLEANACGLPVVAGQDGGSTDAVKNGVNGLVVDGKSVEKIASAMFKLATDPDLAYKIGKQGLMTATNSDWSRKADQFVDFCDSLHKKR